MKFGKLLTIVVCLAVSALQASAQTVKGIVIESSGRPIQDAIVSLLDPAGAEVVGGVRTDREGVFLLHVANAGRYRVKAIRVGFAPVTGPELALGAAESVSLELVMSKTIQALAPVRIIERRPLTLTELMSTSGFDLRRTKGSGSFLTAGELADLGEFANITRTSKFAGLTLRPGSDRMDVLELRRAGGFCRPDFYLDGMIISNGVAGPERAMLTLGALQMDHLYGVEMHRGDALPPSLAGQMGSTGNTCGSLAVWTRSAVAPTVLTGSADDARRVIFRGVVIDDSSKAPLSNVSLVLVTENEVFAGGLARTDSLGRFRMEVRQRGRYRLQASRIGYRKVTTPPFDADQGVTTGFELVMSAKVQLLAPLTITERYRPSARALIDPMEGFEWRKRMGNGTFFDRPALEARNALRVSDVLRGLAGVRVMGGEVRFARAAANAQSAAGCAPAVFLNGTLLRIDPLGRIDQLQMDQVIGLEVFRGPSQVPAEYSGSDSGCGAIAVWILRGSERDVRRPDPPAQGEQHRNGY
jgi:hypothetical protein